MSTFEAHLREAWTRLRGGDAERARAICDELLGQRPGLVPARYLRGLAAAQSGDEAQALIDLAATHEAQPDNAHAAFWLGRLLRRAGRYEDAIAPLERAARQAEYEVDARYELARSLSRSRRRQDAEAHYRRILEIRPGHADAAANLAFSLERRNRLTEAAAAANRALESDPANFMANLTRAVLDRRSGRLTAAVDRLARLAESTTDPHNLSIVLNQTGQCLDALQDWPGAFSAFARANTLLRSSHPHGQPEHDGSYGIATLQSLHRWLVANPVRDWSANLHASPANPVFLVGFPRSGTTLLDQLLSTHSEVEVCEEFELLDEVRARWVDDGRIRTLNAMSDDELGAARAVYRAALDRRRRHPQRNRVVDKLPLNLAYLFLVHRLFPDARIVFAMRDPRDACLSCFFQAFDLQGAMPYFLDLDDTARYYDTVMRLATDTLAQLPNPVHHVRYESLVGNLEHEARELLAFLGLGWQPGVLAYRERALERSIDTPSYQQVVQPLYSRSIGRWRHYREFMGPASGILDSWVERFGYR